MAKVDINWIKTPDGVFISVASVIDIMRQLNADQESIISVLEAAVKIPSKK